ncbi:MAG: hypothetical protein CSB15_01240 [Clostridiales bacterium]|nr:MAG: hypothetical protein CSB15_01240 [Clostridiales bacterium]
MNFLKKLKDISSKFVFYELDKNINLGNIILKKAFKLPLSKDGINDISLDSIDINLKKCFINMGYIIAKDRTSILSKSYMDFIKTISNNDDRVLKSLLSEVSFKDENNLASIYGFAISTNDVFYYNILGKALLDLFVETNNVNFLDDSYTMYLESEKILVSAECYYYLSFIESEKDEFIKSYDYALKCIEIDDNETYKNLLLDGMNIIKDRSLIMSAENKVLENDFKNALLILDDLSLESDRLWKKHICLGKIYMNLGENVKAIESLKRALEINPSEVEIYFLLGNLSIAVGDLLKAKEILESGVKLEPLNTKMLKSLSVLYSKISKKEIAVSVLNTVLKIDPKDDEAKNLFIAIEREIYEN